MTPRYFIVCNGQAEIALMMNDGWTDLVRGAKFNNLTVIDGLKDEDRHFWHMLSRRRKKENIREREKETERFKRFEGLSFQHELQGDTWKAAVGDRCSGFEFDEFILEDKRDGDTSGVL